MASSFEKSVKGATKIKLAPPKTKYIEHILVATHAGEAGVGEVFRALQYRLRDSTWTVVFKSLITVHLMIREGSPDATLAYLSKHRNMLAMTMFSDAQTQGRNLRHYADYLTERARAYRETKCDWVRAKESRLEKLPVEKGLLRETEIVQHQLTALLKCDVLENEPENEITITAFRLLVLDLLALFQVLNQAMINILGHFFEMSKPDAERAMAIYRTFTRQTDYVVQYLSVARQHEHQTRVEVPKLKHAPVNLGRQLEEYLKDPDFEIHRRQYLAELEAKKSKGGGSGAASSSSSKPFKTEPSSSKAAASAAKSATAPSSSAAAANGSQAAAPSTKQSKGADQDLIDFFDSIEQNQTTMAVPPVPTQQPGVTPWGTSPFPMQQPTGAPVPNGFAPQVTGYVANSPFQQQPQQLQLQPQQQLQPNFTGAGFGGYTPQPSFQPSTLAPIPQNAVASFQTGSPFQSMPTGQQQQQQTGTTNPFRQSMLLTVQANPPYTAAQQQQAHLQQLQLQQQQQQQQQTQTLSQPQQQPQLQQQRPLTSQSTNPFARSPPQSSQPFSTPSTNSPFQSQPPPAAPLQPTPTGTNPFAKHFTGSSSPTQQQQRPATAAGLVPQPTGSTNPFRQSAFVNHATGMGWQHNQQPLGGGLDQLETVPVFPRPTQQSPWQQ
ncbi:hypothetical protein VTK73DRAFT_1487 [Phialemonium thermophilum]|uniref:ENTH domain-containing protein n=1 Tax=Phialemonium thermophilum TaxID=223376 RepID=A0ABR3VTH0_9PEZI